MRTGQTKTVPQFLGEVVEHFVAWRRDVFQQLLHQLVIVVGERLQHGEARFLLAAQIVAVERDDCRGSVFLVDEGPFEREIDEAGDDVGCQIGIWRSSNGLRDAGCNSLSVSRRRLSALSILLRKTKRGMLRSSSSRMINCNCAIFLSSASQTTTAASTAGKAARMSCTNSTEPDSRRRCRCRR